MPLPTHPQRYRDPASLVLPSSLKSLTSQDFQQLLILRSHLNLPLHSPLLFPHVCILHNLLKPPECVDVLSECSDQPNNEELEILEEEDEDEDEEEEDLTPTNSVKAAFSPNHGGGGSGSHYRNNSQRQRTRSNHDRDNNFGGNQQQQQQQQHRRSTGSSSTAERERVISTSSSIGVGVEERLGQRPEDSLLANATVNDGTLTTPTAGAGPASISHPGSPSSSSSPSSPRSHENSLHLNNHHHHHHQHPHHPSPARLPSLNDSDAGNHDTIHSTEKLIHV